MAENDWSLVEYRPGRYVKLSADGEVLGKATEAEARAWFARRGWFHRATAQDAFDEAAPARGRREEPARRDAPPETTEIAPEPVTWEAPASAQPEQVQPQITQRVLSDDTFEPGADETEAEPETVSAEHRVASVEPVRPAAVAAVEAAPEEPSSPRAERLYEDQERWLWLDPRGAAPHSSEGLDVAAFLRNAANRFRAKEWTAGSEPRRLAVHPDMVTERLEAAAVELGLEVVSDPRVMPGTYMLGLAEPGHLS